MKNTITFLLALMAAVAAFGQTPWRTATLAHTAGLSPDGSRLNMTSASVFYELRDGYAISSWTGIQWRSGMNLGWMSSQAVVSRDINNIRLGAGVQYNNAAPPAMLQFGTTFAVVQAQIRFNLP